MYVEYLSNYRSTQGTHTCTTAVLLTKLWWSYLVDSWIVTIEGQYHQPLPFYNTVLLGNVSKTVEQTGPTGRWCDSLPPSGSPQYCDHAYQGTFHIALTSYVGNIQFHVEFAGSSVRDIQRKTQFSKRITVKPLKKCFKLYASGVSQKQTLNDV